jgi:cystathionine gamma-lyase
MRHGLYPFLIQNPCLIREIRVPPLEMALPGNSNHNMKFATKAIHAGIEPDPSTGAVMTPIYQTSTYAQASPGEHKGYEYARTQNPTRSVLEKNLAALENGTEAICFSSGLAAQDAVIKLLSAGDEVLAVNDLYGGSYRQMIRVWGQWGLKSRFIDMYTAANVENEISPATKLIWIETPTNPMLNIVDIAAVCAIARKHGIMTCVDNTFASPYLQNPLDLGADIVLHSATKYIGGHSDVVHGALIVKDAELAQRLHFLQNACGAVPGPQDCFLILRGIKTLHLRVQRACENAAVIAQFLAEHPKVGKVYWPGFAMHPGHGIAKKQMRMFGAMVSFDLKNNSLEDATKVMSNTELFTLAESLGGVESLIGHPASMTHASIPREARLKVGLTDSLIRLSVGVEDVDDLVEDLEKALRHV